MQNIVGFSLATVLRNRVGVLVIEIISIGSKCEAYPKIFIAYFRKLGIIFEIFPDETARPPRSNWNENH